jgi:hypothetical protein
MNSEVSQVKEAVLRVNSKCMFNRVWTVVKTASAVTHLVKQILYRN